MQNQGLRENKRMLSERLRLVSESLRGAGQVLDESIDFDEMFESDNKGASIMKLKISYNIFDVGEFC